MRSPSSVSARLSDTDSRSAPPPRSSFLAADFPGYLLLERHDRHFRFRLPSSSSPAAIFRAFEQRKDALGIEEYGVSQASREPPPARRPPARPFFPDALSRCWSRRNRGRHTAAA